MYDIIIQESPVGYEAKIREEKKVTRKVKRFYEKIQFPGRRPIEQDSLIFFRKFTNLVQSYEQKNHPVRVLDAGCGTGNTSLFLASQFNAVQFVGLDLSSTSIATAQKIAGEKDLSNIKFCEWNLLDPLEENIKFDIILCFGVLHHTAQMQKALDHIAQALEPDGTIFLWVYGKHGRYFHSLNIELLSLLLSMSQEDENDIDLTREFITKTQNGKIITDLLGERSDDQMLKQFYTDATWISDQFLNPNEYMVDLKDLFNLSKNSGLQISEWVGMPKDISPYLNSAKLEKCFTKLSTKNQMVALDLLLKMDRYFLVLKKS